MANVGLYLRISDDQDGTSTATERQRQDLERHAKYREWDVTDTFEDKDLSAFSKKVRRAEFERMIAAVKAKEIDVVLAWRMDRLARRLSDFVKLNDAAEEAGAWIVTTADGIDTSTDSGRFVAPILVQVGNQESRNMSTRLRREALEQAQAGKPTTGGTRMFGYSQDRKTIDSEEAQLVREAATRLLAGGALRGICLDWRKRGVKTPSGNEWQQGPLKRLMQSPALSAQREIFPPGTTYLEKRKGGGQLVAGQWPAILTPDDSRRLRLMLSDSSRMKNKVGNARSYLLTGFLKCALCGQPLSARPRLDGVHRYVCARQPGTTNCGKIARIAEPIEELVKEAVLLRLDGVNLREYVKRPTDNTEGVLDAIRHDEEKLESLAKDFSDDTITREEWLAARTHLTTRLETNRTKVAKSNGHGVLNQFVGAGAEVRRLWAEKDLDWKRSIIGALVDHIVIDAAVKGRQKFDPSLVKISWKI